MITERKYAIFFYMIESIFPTNFLYILLQVSIK